MTHITCNYTSPALAGTARFHLFLPQAFTFMNRKSENRIPEQGYPLLVLLHGLSDNADSWILHSSVSDLADRYQLAILLPSAGNTFYLDGVNGANTYTYITEELLYYARSIFPLSSRREDTYLGGYSMGGYGAIRMGLLQPDLFHRVFSLSGSLSLRAARCYARACGFSLPDCLSSPSSSSAGNLELSDCLQQVQDIKRYPAFYLACGQQDFFLKCNQEFFNSSRSRGLSIVYHPSEGIHDWSYWNQALSKAVNWCMSKAK